jgi:hypothetical protein
MSMTSILEICTLIQVISRGKSAMPNVGIPNYTNEGF